MDEEEKDQISSSKTNKQIKKTKNREGNKFKEQKATYNSVCDVVEIRMVVKIDSV